MVKGRVNCCLGHERYEVIGVMNDGKISWLGIQHLQISRKRLGDEMGKEGEEKKMRFLLFDIFLS